MSYDEYEFEYENDWSNPAGVYEEAMEQGDHQTALEAQSRIAIMAAQQVVAANPPPTEYIPYVPPKDAGAIADRALADRYGQEYADLRGKVAERLAAEPDLLPDDALYSPTEFERRLDVAFQLVKAEQPPDRSKPTTGKAAEELWASIKNADTGTYGSKMGW